MRGMQTAAILLLLLVAFWQARRIQDLEARVQSLDAQNGAALAEFLGRHGDDVRRAGRWLHEIYRSPHWLARPGGLCEGGAPDVDAMVSWLLDTYVIARLDGASEDEARARILRSVEASDEWRVKHRR